MLCDKVVLNVDELALAVDLFECVTAITMVEAPSSGCAMVAEEH
jgi:hypothetical protein